MQHIRSLDSHTIHTLGELFQQQRRFTFVLFVLVTNAIRKSHQYFVKNFLYHRNNW